MPRHELPLHAVLVRRIVSLLSRTDFSLDEIAERMGCTASFVAAIDQKYEVREYQRLRKPWPFVAEEVERRGSELETLSR